MDELLKKLNQNFAEIEEIHIEQAKTFEMVMTKIEILELATTLLMKDMMKLKTGEEIDLSDLKIPEPRNKRVDLN